jgi:protein TonB
MSQPQVSPQSKPAPEAGPLGYQLSSDLARMCLPAEFKDSYRNLAYANSICILFLLIGAVGFKVPRVIIKPLSEVSEPIPVVFTPPEEVQQPDKPDVPDEPPPPTDQPMDTPAVAVVAAVADSSAVAFSVPVKGAVAVASVRYAAPPPANLTAPPPRPAPVKFNPNATSDGGVYPQPMYPRFAMRQKQQGIVIVEMKVDADGAVISAEVFKSSGYTVLDEAAVDVVKTRWRFPAGPVRLFQWSCTFQLN